MSPQSNNIGKGIIWTLLGQYSTQFLTLFFGIFLARLLTPEDYGLIGMVAIFISVGDVFTNSGLGIAIVQRKTVTGKDLDTVFWTNILIGCLIGIILYSLNGVIADFFSEPRLRDIIKVYAITFLISALTITQFSQLRRKLLFRKVESIDVFAALGGGVLGIVCALKGFSYWSIIIQQLSSRLIRLGVCVYYNRWLPSFRFSRESFDSFISFSAYALSLKVLRITVNKLDVAITGKVATSSVTGLFAKAQFLANLPSTTFVKALQKASFPILSKLQDDKKQLADAYRKMILVSVFIIYPAMFLLWNYAELAIQILLGNHWLGVVPYLKLFCFVVLFYPYNELSINVLMARGKAKESFRIELGIRLTLLLFLLLGVYLGGVEGLIYAKIIVGVLAFFISTRIISNNTDYTVKQQYLDLFQVNLPFYLTATIVILCASVCQIHELVQILMFCLLFVLTAKMMKNEIMLLLWEKIRVAGNKMKKRL